MTENGRFIGNKRRACPLVLADGKEWWVPRLSIAVSTENDGAWKAIRKLQRLAVEADQLQSRLAALNSNIKHAQTVFEIAARSDDVERAAEYADKIQALEQQRCDLETRDFPSELAEKGARFAYELLRMAYSDIKEDDIPELITPRELALMMDIARGETPKESNPTEEKEG